jgi:transposase
MVSIEELIMLMDLKRQGLSVSAIAAHTGRDRKTVRKYLAAGGTPPKYSPRPTRKRITGAFEDYVRGRLAQWPTLSAVRLLAEVREQGYSGSRSAFGALVQQLRPSTPPAFEKRFETGPGHQAQVDFAEFRVQWHGPSAHLAQPSSTRVWLFSMVLGHSRYLWGEFVLHQDLPTLLRCHMQAFEHLGGVPREILYDRMKTAVLGQPSPTEPVVYNAKLLQLAAHYGFTPRACKPYRAKTKGKVERPFRYIRENFFLARQFASLEDLNAQWRTWLDQVAHQRTHGTTGHVVAEHFARERSTLKPLPAGRFDAVLALDRRVTSDGWVSASGNYYSVPDGTPRHVSIELTADQVRILAGQRIVAVHALLTGRRQCSLLPGHRARSARTPPAAAMGHAVSTRPLAIYDLIAQRLGAQR